MNLVHLANSNPASEAHTWLPKRRTVSTSGFNPSSSPKLDALPGTLLLMLRACCGTPVLYHQSFMELTSLLLPTLCQHQQTENPLLLCPPHLHSLDRLLTVYTMLTSTGLKLGWHPPTTEIEGAVIEYVLGLRIFWMLPQSSPPFPNLPPCILVHHHQHSNLQPITRSLC